MANFTVPDPPGYSGTMRMLETSDLAHADLFNALYARVLENCEYLKAALGKVDVVQIGAIPAAEKGATNGVATLDAAGKVPANQLPSYVDDVVEYAGKAKFPATGEAGKIYVDTATNLTYRWTGSTYVEISQSLGLGETASTAYPGNKGAQTATELASLKTTVANQKEQYVTATLTASGWNASTKTYSFESQYPSSTWDIEIEAISTCSDAQAKAWAKASPIMGSATSNVLKAYGTVPTVDIPILITKKKK